MHVINDSPPNKQGIIDLSSDHDPGYLVFPGNNNTGLVVIFDSDSLTTVCHFSAHDGPIAALRINPDSTKLATASDKGTVIRVFDITNGQRLFEFSRGVKRLF